MAEPSATFVQFPHPGREHRPQTDDMPWNVGGHGRKFLHGSGAYVDDAGRIHRTELVFWGEWEAPSRIERRWLPHGRLPRALHRPYWVRPAMDGSRENTDPWVFGDSMIYSNCKQVAGQGRRPTSMQNLPVGSVIVFGSTIDHEFCLDTVFVVSSAEPWVPADAADNGVDPAFTVCTAESLIAGGTDAHTRLTLYRGATVDAPVHGMYSFVPARPAADDGPRFARPAVRLDGLINPASRQSTRGSKRRHSLTRVRDAWQQVRRQVLDDGLVLATRFDTPPRDTRDRSTPETDRTRC